MYKRSTNTKIYKQIHIDLHTKIMYKDFKHKHKIPYENTSFHTTNIKIISFNRELHTKIYKHKHIELHTKIYIQKQIDFKNKHTQTHRVTYKNTYIGIQT